MIRRLKKQRGFTLVELMIVVAIIGILAALAVYGVKRYMTSAKTGEAKENLGRIGKDASAAYQRENMAGTVLDPGASADAVHRLCASATAPVPAAVPKGQKTQPAADAWGGTPSAGWLCLKFSVNDPLYYQYNYTAADVTAGFTATATGNLDGDETNGEPWTLAGVINAETKDLRLAPTIAEPTDPSE